jgi:class 3 adenylate cyclase
VTTDDIQALRSAKQALDLGLPVPVLLQLLRVFADNMERLAEAENRIFHDHVHERFRAEGLSGRELMEATAGISSGLLELVEPTVLYFHRRAWAAAAQHDFIRHLTEDSRPVQTSPGAAPCAVMFADLSGFTPLTAAMGDQAAAEVLSRFAGAVRRVTAAHDGRVVKQIGDAFMLVFEDRGQAVRCGAELVARCALEPRFPPVHVGAHSGEVLFHDGDYVGAAVNLAARVAAVTDPSQFLVTADLLDGLEVPPDLTLRPLGSRALKGLPEPVAVTAVSQAAPEASEPDRRRYAGSEPT